MSAEKPAVPDVSEMRTRRVAQAVMDYVTRHPMAADSEAGIQQVWLSATGIDESPQHLRSALDQLVAQRRLERVALADGSAIYRAAGRRS